jgi:phospholipase/carboxylesterase
MRNLSAVLALLAAAAGASADDLDDRVIRAVLTANRPPDPTAADNAFKEKKWLEAAKAYLEYVGRKPDDAEAWYRLAASLSRAGRQGSAANALTAAVRVGFEDMKRAEEDPDLEGLRKSPAFAAAKKLIAEARPLQAETIHVKGAAFAPCHIATPKGYDRAKKYGLVVLLHGHGGHPMEFLRSVQDWAGEEFVLASVQAPNLRVAAGCPLGFSWSLEGSQGAEAEKLAVEYVVEAVRAVSTAYSIDPGRVVIAGSSQGAAMTLRVVGERPNLFSDVVLMMCGAQAPKPDAFKGKRVLVAHGVSDATAPFENGKKLFESAETAGAASEWFPFEGGHALTPGLLKGVRAWLKGEKVPEECKAKGK